MAHVFNVVIGTATITMGDTLMAFTPKAPADDSGRMADSFTAYITQATINSLQRALDRARAWDSNRTGDAVYINFQPGSTGTTWRSRVYDGRISLTKNALGSDWANAQFETIVAVERDPFWEGAETTLAATNTSGTSTAGLTVINSEDEAVTGNDFYATIAENAVSGDLPTPAMIYYKNTTNDVKGVSALCIGHFAEGAGLETPPIQGILQQGSGTTDGSSSGGSYVAVVWATGAETSLTTWSGAFARLYQHNYKVIARFSEAFAYTDLYLKAKLLYGSAVLGETRWQLADANKEMQVIGSMKILPYSNDLMDYGGITLALYGKMASGSGTAKLDYVALIPQDSYRALSPVTGAAYNETIVDDPVAGQLYTIISGNFKRPTHIVEEGEPIMLAPQRKNTLYFLHDTTDGEMEIARTGTVVIKYRPRVRTI
jgi:hypothetical protein